MRQILQNLRSGKVEVAEVPAPVTRAGHLLVQTTTSLISAGTERMLTQFARANLVEKALQQPERVRQVLDNMRTNGVVDTLEAVRSKLDQPIPLGYSNVGRILAVGHGVQNFSVGDRVLSNGHHAEVVCVPKNLCAKIPDAVTDETASFGVLSAIALQGARLIEPTLGERIVVIGLGLLGQLAIQILRANGCQVLGFDVDPTRVALARSFGVAAFEVSAGTDPVRIAQSFSDQIGVDAVLITASTASSEPVAQAAGMCRKKGRIVLVGVTGLELNRADFYEKELSFQVSCSYGPGRYDPMYEQGGHDYPVGFVRWTEQRNFEAILALMASGSIRTDALVSHRVDVDAAAGAYEALAADGKVLGVVLRYPERTADVRASIVSLGPRQAAARSGPAKATIGLIGAGNFASRVLVPILTKLNAAPVAVVSQSGMTAYVQGKKAGAQIATTEVEAVINDPAINTIIIATRHDTHADLAVRAITAGKHVFVEKPLAITAAQLEQVEQAHRAGKSGSEPLLMVGFNRRFSPLTQEMMRVLRPMSEPKVVVATVNAGSLPRGHWTQSHDTGGGRIIGEACHFIDLLRFIVGSQVTGVRSTFLRPPGSAAAEDVATIVLEFGDGSHGTIHYLANGSRQFPKERIEVFVGGRVLQLDNFRTLRAFGWPKYGGKRLWRQDKGHLQCMAAFLSAVEAGGPSPIPSAELFEVCRRTIDAAHQHETP